MKRINFIMFLTFVLISCGMRSEREKVREVEGIFYLDNSPVRVTIANGKITGFTRLSELTDKTKAFYIAPGLIDNQVNGFMGESFVFGGGTLTREGVVKITKALWQVGVTTYLPTLTTNDPEALRKSMTILAKSKQDPEIMGSIAGIHLEGPYISPVDGYRGAHPLKHVRKPDWNEFMKYYEASGRSIIQITLAPEVEGAMDLISKCREKNIIVALGHHNGNTSQVTEAVDRGARIATHFGNGCANTINRHVNPLWPQLAEDRLMISMIADGFHLRPEQIRTFYRVKGPENTILTSDVTSFGGLPAGKYLNEDGDTIEHTVEGALIYPAQKVLYGSASPLLKGVGHVMRVTGCTLGQAIRMASTNPARLYGLADRGELNPGMRADIILFTIDDFRVNIKKTIVAGELVYDSSQ